MLAECREDFKKLNLPVTLRRKYEWVNVYFNGHFVFSFDYEIFSALYRKNKQLEKIIIEVLHEQGYLS